MPLVAAAILPHGTAAIPGFKEGRADFSEVTLGIRQAAAVLAERRADTVVIASPHNLRVEGKMAVVTTENCGGFLEQGKKRVKLSWKCDRKLAAAIYASATERGLPAVGVNFGTSEGPESRMPLDWGTLVPLWFLPRKVRVVLITPSREIPWKDLVAMGECVRDACNGSQGRVAFIASADQGHAHKKSGPYGLDSASEEYDMKMTSIVKSGKLGELLRFKPEFVERAKPDSLWQTLVLLGALRGTGFKPRTCSYSCPTYYGMLSAAFS